MNEGTKRVNQLEAKVQKIQERVESSAPERRSIQTDGRKIQQWTMGSWARA